MPCLRLHTLTRTGLAAALVLLCAVAGAAQESAAEPNLGPFFRHSYSLKWTAPQRVSMGITGMLCVNRDRWNSGPSVAGILVQAEPGIGGLKLGLGYGFVSSVRTFTGDSLGFLGHLGVPWLGWSAKFVALRTIYNPWNVAPGQTYLGLDLQANLIMLNVNVGLLRHVDGDHPRREWLFVWGLGYGF